MSAARASPVSGPVATSASPVRPGGAASSWRRLTGGGAQASAGTAPGRLRGIPGRDSRRRLKGRGSRGGAAPRAEGRRRSAGCRSGASSSRRARRGRRGRALASGAQVISTRSTATPLCASRQAASAAREPAADHRHVPAYHVHPSSRRMAARPPSRRLPTLGTPTTWRLGPAVRRFPAGRARVRGRRRGRLGRPALHLSPLRKERNVADNNLEALRVDCSAADA